MKFGEALRDARIKRGYTQEDLQKLIGISSKSIGLIENGERHPRYGALVKMIRLFPELIEKVKEDSK